MTRLTLNYALYFLIAGAFLFCVGCEQVESLNNDENADKEDATSANRVLAPSARLAAQRSNPGLQKGVVTPYSGTLGTDGGSGSDSQPPPAPDDATGQSSGSDIADTADNAEAIDTGPEISAPSVVHQPEEIEVSQGATFVFFVEATGDDLAYQWRRFGVNIPGATSASYSGEASYADHEASFSCVVSNGGGAVISQSARLLVSDVVPPVLEISGAAKRVTESDTITIEGVATDSGTGVEAVSVTSDRYLERNFGALVSQSGVFSAEIPLKVGTNILVVTARDAAGNEATGQVEIESALTPTPRVIVTSPESGAVTQADLIDVTGVIRSSLSPKDIRVTLENRILFPAGSDGEYSFVFKDVRLSEGINHFDVVASSAAGNGRASFSVRKGEAQDEQEPGGPRVELRAESPIVYTSKDAIFVSGTAISDSPIVSVAINDQSVPFIGSDKNISFETTLAFPEGQHEVEVVAEVINQDGAAGRASYNVRRDSTAPQLSVQGLEPAPAVNDLTITPWTLRGTVTEPNLAGLTLENQSIQVQPSRGDDAWSFDVVIPLARQERKELDVVAWDLAGNSTSRSFVVQLVSSLNLEVISPRRGEKLLGSGESMDVEITAQAPGLSPGDRVTASLDGQAEVTLVTSGFAASGSVSVPIDGGAHSIAVTVKSGSGQAIATAQTTFEVADAADIPLELIRTEPANQAKHVEPNAPIVFYLNRPVNTSSVTIEVLETVHSKAFDVPGAVDITKMSAVALVDLHRDNEPVPGGLSFLPGDMIVAFYPKRPFAYGAKIFASLSSEGAEIGRRVFTVRPLPTLLQGFVADQDMQPLQGIEVAVPALGISAKTDREGGYQFGFGESADRMIPAGRHLFVFNPGQKSDRFGTIEQWVFVEAERFNLEGMTLLPALKPTEPWRHILSGQAHNTVAGGLLNLDLSQATVTFADGRTEGDVNVRALERHQLPYQVAAPFSADFAFVFAPAAIEVEGNLAFSIRMPDFDSSAREVEGLPPYVLVLGLDPDSLQLAPMGVAKIDSVGKQIVTVSKLDFKRLDAIGIALVHANKQEILKRYVDQETSLGAMISELASK